MKASWINSMNEYVHFSLFKNVIRNWNLISNHISFFNAASKQKSQYFKAMLSVSTKQLLTHERFEIDIEWVKFLSLHVSWHELIQIALIDVYSGIICKACTPDDRCPLTFKLLWFLGDHCNRVIKCTYQNDRNIRW